MICSIMIGKFAECAIPTRLRLLSPADPCRAHVKLKICHRVTSGPVIFYLCFAYVNYLVVRDQNTLTPTAIVIIPLTLLPDTLRKGQ